MRVAVLDIGSNSVLLLIAQRTADRWQVLTDQATITRLGEGFEPDRLLKPQAVQRTLTAIEQYLRQCHTMEVERVVAVATGVVRRAVNREVLLQPLESMGCSVRVLSEQEEAVLSFLAVAQDPAMFAPPPNPDQTAEEYMSQSEEIEPAPESNGETKWLISELRQCVPFARTRRSTNGEHESTLWGEAAGAWLVIDIGGGSVEFAYAPLSREPSQLRWRSLPVGAMTLREQLAPSNPPDPNEIERVCRWLDRQFRFLGLLPPPEQVVTVGGTGVNLARLWCALHDMPATVAEVHGFRLTLKMLGEMLDLLLSLSDEKRAQLPGVEPERAPLLHLGTLILMSALDAAHMRAVRVSTYGLRYGVLWQMAGDEPPTQS